MIAIPTYENVHSFGALLAAFHKARRAKRGRGDEPGFYLELESNLLSLSDELRTRTFVPDAYRYFSLHNKKDRVVSVASFRDRVVHHALVAELEPFYESRFIPTSFACRKDKGMHRALRLAHHLSRRHGYFLKLDIRKYFDHISHPILLDTLALDVSDDGILWLSRTLLAFLRRLATLLPAPYQNLVRYHGVFANRSRYRKALPHPPVRPKNARGDDKTPGDRQLPNVPVTPKPGEFRKRTHPSWAGLLHRALHVDVLSCPRCATPMAVLAFLTDPAVVTRILDHLHLPSTVPTIAPARDPDDLWAMDDHGVREPTSGYVTFGRRALRRPGDKASRPGPGPARDPPAFTIS